MHRLAALVALATATPAFAQVLVHPDGAATIPGSRSPIVVAPDQANAARHDRLIARRAAASGDTATAAAAQRAEHFHAYQARRAARIARRDRGY